MTRGKRRSEAQWQAIIEQQSDSGLNVVTFCQQQSLCRKTFYKYRREARAVKNTDLSSKGFIKIKRPPSAAVLTMTAPTCILHYHSCKLQIQPNRDNAGWLADIMKALS